MKKTLLSVLSLLLVIAMAVSFVACGDKKDDPKDSSNKPTEGQPTGAQPTEGQPTEGQPTEGQPTKAQPTKAQPTEAQPTEAQPTEAQPTEAQPTASETEAQAKDPYKDWDGRVAAYGENLTGGFDAVDPFFKGTKIMFDEPYGAYNADDRNWVYVAHDGENVYVYGEVMKTDDDAEVAVSVYVDFQMNQEECELDENPDNYKAASSAYNEAGPFVGQVSAHFDTKTTALESLVADDATLTLDLDGEDTYAFIITIPIPDDDIIDNLAKGISCEIGMAFQYQNCDEGDNRLVYFDSPKPYYHYHELPSILLVK